MSTNEPTLSTLVVDKTALSVGFLSDDSDEKTYWLGKTPHERLEALELMRQIIYGYEDSAPPGFQRVFELVKR
ncbi:MAG: hypothetical protein ACRD4L_03100 [Pyrinomonadaceae bacterium]